MMSSAYANILQYNADGVIVLDHAGKVVYANPQAERFFAGKTDPLVGETFGYPIVAGESSEIELVRVPDPPLYVEMRAAAIPWQNPQTADATLVSLRDISRRRKLEEALRHADQLNTAILNALHASIAVLNHEGVIIRINDIWAQFARDNGDPDVQYTGVGVNYFDVCRSGDDPVGQAALHGMEAVLSGQLPAFEMEYPCHSPTENRWFLMRVLPMQAEGLRGLVVAHINVTHYRQATIDEIGSDADVLQRQRQQLEFDYFELLSYPTLKPVVGAPLNSQQVTHFSRVYAQLLEQALEQRAYKIKRDTAAQAEALAERLGSSSATPRDVVKIHTQALETMRVRARTPVRVQAAMEEGRMLLVELMGYLVSYYRKRVVTNDPPAANSADNGGTPYGRHEER